MFGNVVASTLLLAVLIVLQSSVLNYYEPLTHHYMELVEYLQQNEFYYTINLQAREMSSSVFDIRLH